MADHSFAARIVNLAENDAYQALSRTASYDLLLDLHDFGMANNIPSDWGFMDATDYAEFVRDMNDWVRSID